MRVVQVNYTFDDGLADPEELLERYTTLTGWSEALLEAGARQVSVVQRFHTDARLRRRCVDYVFQHDGGDGHPSRWSGSWALHQHVVKHDADVVHVNGLNVPVQTWRLRRQLPQPAAIVIQDHASMVAPVAATDPLRSFRRAVWRRGLRVADAFLFSVAEQAELWRSEGFIATAQRVHTVMEASTDVRPIDRDRARRESGVTGDPALLWVGRLNRNKDPLTVLDGFAQCLSRLPGATLTMVFGADDVLPSVRGRLGATPELENRVQLAGKMSPAAMPAFYSAADIFVLGSHHEGSGYALLEACACGLVPVVTDIPTFRAITSEGTLGALFTPGQADEFARALMHVATGDIRRLKKKVAEHFDQALSWHAVGCHALDAYRDAVRTRRGGE